jgi:hypothetical protein
MNLIEFHKNWLGKDPNHTPKEFQISPPQMRLYESQGRGFSSKEKEFVLFVGILILALSQIKPNKGQVILITPDSHLHWVTAQMSTIARYMIRTRKKSAEGVALVRTILSQILLNTRPMQISEPTSWVSFGLSREDPLPEWLSNRLIDV